MDRYELKETIREIDNLISRHKFKEAEEVADTMDWRKVRSVRVLCRISDLYKVNRRYEDSKRVLELAYAKYPRGRQIIYSLCELELKLGNYVRALQLYNEYINVAPRDSDRYVLQYKLYKEQNVGIGERIAVLEELARNDYREKWAFELARLYNEAGETARCIAQCDELIAFFGDGRYVRRALQLKRSITELSRPQEEAYRRMTENGRKQKAVREERARQETEEQENFVEEVTEEERKAGQILRETSDLPKGTGGTDGSGDKREDEQTEKEKETETAASFDRNTFQVNPLEETPYSPEAMQKTIVRGLQDLNNYDAYLSQETDGQYKMVMDEQPEPDTQIAGQLNLEEIMSEWEKVRRDFYETNGFDPEEPPVRIQMGIHSTAGDTAGASQDNAGGPEENNFAGEAEASDNTADSNTRSWDRREVHRALQIRDDDKEDDAGFDTSLFVTEGGGEFPAEFAVDQSDDEEDSDRNASGASAPKRMYLHSEDSIRQLTDALELVRLDGGRGNVIITGDEGSGTLGLARELVRRFRRKNPDFVGQIAKSEGQYITRENVASVIPRMPFGALIIEHAASMSEEGTAALCQMLDMPDRSILVILIDRKGVMDAFLSDHQKVREMFPARIDIAALSVGTLLGYAREYAGKQQCDIDEYGINALESRILSMQTIEHSVTLEDIRNIVDEAIYYANRKSLSTLVDSFSRRRGTGSIRTVLRDKDFLHY